MPETFEEQLKRAKILVQALEDSSSMCRDLAEQLKKVKDLAKKLVAESETRK